MQTTSYEVKGMHCASCAGIIEKTFKKQPGVETAEVNYATQTAKVSFDNAHTTPEKLSASIEPFGYSLHLPTAASMNMSESEHAAHLGLGQSKKDQLQELKQMRTQIFIAIPLAIFSIAIMTWDVLVQTQTVAPMSIVIEEFVHHLLPIMASYMLFVIGRPYLLGVYRFLRYGKANMDTLIGIGTSVAFIYSFIVTAFEESLKPFINVEQTYYDVTIVVIAFIALGKYLETRSKLKTGDAIEKLLNLQAKTALVMRDGQEQEIPASEVIVGDSIIIKPGAKIPVDGIISEGSSFLDESMITGEPMPAEKKTGDAVVAGTLNTTGSFTFKATKVGAETLLAHIITMVREAQGSKAPIQALADKISSVFVPIVLVIAVLTLATWLIAGASTIGFSQALSFGLTSFVGILVIACPCALGLATPTAIIVGVGKGAREGILIKDAATLEKLYKVTTVVVDKTGTITKGKPELVSLKNYSERDDKDILGILTSLEKKSEHPIAEAILRYAQAREVESRTVDNFSSIKGQGLQGTIDGTEYFAGNMKLLSMLGLPFDGQKLEQETKQGRTPVLLATKLKVLAVIMVADAVKPEAKGAIAQLHKMKIKVIMLTGDMRATAETIAHEVGIDEVVAEVMPDDKLNKIKALQQKGQIIAMAGDGVNDAPALAQADVGIAMGTGTDVAIETAGITLLHGDISKLVKAIRLSRLTMRGIKQNLFWAFFYNIIGIPIAAGVLYPFFGLLLSPIFAGLAMALSSVSVVSNSLRLKTKKL